jgi:hypothetical protein
MRARTARSPLYAAGLTAILAAALAGCSAASSGTPGASGSGSGTAAAASPLDAVRLAAKTADGATSFTGTMSVQTTAKSGASGNVDLTATIAEQLRPSLLVQVQIGTLQAAGSALPGGLAEILTPSTLYMRWSFLNQELHITKPWLAIPLSAVGKGSGIDFSQIFSQADASNPLSQTQMLGGATSVKKVGTGTVGGVPVTEYTGTMSIDKGLSFLTGSTKATLQKEVAASGFRTATFKVWIDRQHTVRKAVITEDGTAMTETSTITIASLDQPVNITIPAVGQTSPLPSADLSRLG